MKIDRCGQSDRLYEGTHSHRRLSQYCIRIDSSTHTCRWQFGCMSTWFERKTPENDSTVTRAATPPLRSPQQTPIPSPTSARPRVIGEDRLEITDADIHGSHAPSSQQHRYHHECLYCCFCLIFNQHCSCLDSIFESESENDTLEHEHEQRCH